MMTGMGASTAVAAARLSRSLNQTGATAGCRHEHVDPVYAAVTGECVAQICTVCLAQLPDAHGCRDCDWEPVEVRTLCQASSDVVWVLRHPCTAHREAP